MKRPTADAALEKIKSRGHWQVRFRPEPYRPNRIANPEECEQVVEANAVKLRGWSYPHRVREDRTVLGPNYVESAIDWEGHIEFWRFHQSGQFVHLLALREDWLAEDSWAGPLGQTEPGTALSVLGAVYTVTEVFEFVRRLTNAQIYDAPVFVTVNLRNTRGRTLRLWDHARAPLLDEYTSPFENIEWEQRYRAGEILEKSSELGLAALGHIFRMFQWRNPPLATLRSDQERLLKREL